MTSRRSAVGQPVDSSGRAVELAILAGIVVLAAILRLIDLPTRGTFDADQGHDMLVLRDLVVNGQVPLLGPPTSIGDFHHGVLYYWLLAPVAALSGANPIAVTAAIALGGTLAVAVTWWLARSMAGPIAGAIAALLMAISASAIEESTFIWNPNLIALASSIALAAAWRAWTSGRARWWVVAGAACVVTMHLHVLGVVLSPIVAGLLVADLRRAREPHRRVLVRAGVAWLAILAASYVPLAIHEAQTGGSEIRAAAAYLTSNAPADIALPARFPIVGLRVLAWPLAGLVTDGPFVAVLAAALVVALVAWRAVAQAGPGEERVGVRWLGLGLAWTIVTLAVGAAGLATVVMGLPNDHYHAFADPMVFVLVGVGLAAVARWGPRIGRVRSGVPAAALVVVLLAVWNVAHQPPLVAPDGGWPAAAAAAERIARLLPSGPTEIVSLPTVKGPDAVRFPLVRSGAELPGVVDASARPAPDTVARIVLCDGLFRVAIGADCGGPAEDATATPVGLVLADRFQAAPGRWISLYVPG